MFLHSSLFQFTLENHKKAGESFRISERNIFQDLPGYFHLDGSEKWKIVACLPVYDALVAVRPTRLISPGTCGKTLYAAQKNCSRPKNIEIKSEKSKIKSTSQYFQFITLNRLFNLGFRRMLNEPPSWILPKQHCTRLMTDLRCGCPFGLPAVSFHSGLLAVSFYFLVRAAFCI